MLLKVKTMSAQNFDCDVYRINHALKVYGYANAISENELISDKYRVVVELAAILHDVGIACME